MCIKELEEEIQLSLLSDLRANDAKPPLTAWKRWQNIDMDN